MYCSAYWIKDLIHSSLPDYNMGSFTSGLDLLGLLLTALWSNAQDKKLVLLFHSEYKMLLFLKKVIY